MSPPGTYLVTFATWRRQRLFVVERYARLFLRTIYAYRRQGKLQLHAFVLMPEHVHLLLTPAEDVDTRAHPCSSLGAAIRMRSGLSLGNTRVLQRGFTDHRIRDRADFEKAPGMHSRQSRCPQARGSGNGISLLLGISRIQIGRAALSG